MNKLYISLFRKFFIVLTFSMLMASCSAENFSTIDDTINHIEKLDYRVTNSSGNYKFANELKSYLETIENEKAELFTHEYKIDIPQDYELIFTNQEYSLSLNNTNSILISLNEKRTTTKKTVLINSFEQIKTDEEYAFIAYSWEDVNRAKLQPNISVILFVVETDNKQNIIEIDSNEPTFIMIDTPLSEKFTDFINQKISVKLNLTSQEVLLENIYMTYKGSKSKDAIVLTAHYDSYGSTNGVFSKGVLDNGSGVALVLDLLQKTVNSKPNSNMDIIFSFVNSEEQMYLNIPGSKYFNSFLKEEYENILNINLDSLGEKNFDTIFYGISGNVNNDLLIKYIQNNLGEKYTLEKVDHYPSDNVNFENSIFFYNFNEQSSDSILHSDKDNKESIDVNKLESISEELWQLLLSISKLKMEDIIYLNNDIPSCSSEKEKYKKNLDFGQYVFYKCANEANKVHFYVHSRYQKMIKELEDISAGFCKNLSDKNSMYIVTFEFELPEIEYKNQKLEQPESYFNQMPDLKSLINEYPINLFRLHSLNPDTDEAEYAISAQKYPLEQKTLIEYLQQDFAKLEDLTVIKDSKMDIYIGYKNNVRIVESILLNAEGFYVFNFSVYNDTLLSMSSDELAKVFLDYSKDILEVLK